MSCQRGNASRVRCQKYKNKTAFRNDLHDKTPKQIMLNNLNISEVCNHCKSVIEWKIKYKKYKPLSQPKTCTKCHQKNVKKAYHVLCRSCAIGDRVCAKCLQSSQRVEIVPPEPTDSEQVAIKVEMDRLIKSLSERKRRSFLRYMKKGKPGVVLEENDHSDEEDPPTGRPKKVPHSREDLLKKIQELTIIEEDENESDSSSDEDDFSDY